MVGILALFGIFGLVFLCSAFALQHTGLSRMRFPLAACVAVLSVLSFLQEVPASSDEPGSVVHIMLIPYAVLAISLLAVFVMLLVLALIKWLRRLTSWGTDRTRCEKRRYGQKRFKDYPRE